MLLPSRELLDGNLLEFKISTKEDESDHGSDFDEEDDFEYDDSRNVKMDTELDLPFAEMKKEMFVTYRGIYKKILTEGTGDLVPDTARISMDYSGFWEGQSTPFETSWVNKRPRLQRMGEDMLPGMYFALLSMKLGEVSKFIVPYQLLYGALGCDIEGFASIPPEANALYIIRLISFEDIGDSGAINEENIDNYDTFETVLERVAEVRKSARANYADENYSEAAKEYKKIISALSFCQGADEEARKKLLEQMRVNVCVCYNRLERPQEVIKMRDDLKEALTTNCKAIFQFARAHAKQGDYQDALQLLRKAQRLEPNNKEIAQEFMLVDEMNETYKKEMKEIAKKALQNCGDAQKKQHDEWKTSTIYKMLGAVVKKFAEDERKKDKELLPINMSSEALRMIDAIIESYEQVAVEHKRVNNEEWHYLVRVSGES